MLIIDVDLLNRLIFLKEQGYLSREIKNSVEISATVRPVVEVEGLSKL